VAQRSQEQQAPTPTPEALTPQALTPQALTPQAPTPQAVTPQALKPQGLKTSRAPARKGWARPPPEAQELRLERPE
jgi:hypothetical protein